MTPAPRALLTLLPLAFTLAAGCADRGAPAASTAPSATPAGPPTRFEIYQLLFRERDLPLARGQHCSGVVGAALDHAPTLGDWIAYNLSVLDEGEIHLPAACRPSRSAGAAWDCEVQFQAAGGESPWSWGVRFRLRPDRVLVPGSLACTGGG